ncbi:MAG: hypothetical protein HY587_01660 [Candidatus Omnitrophica bacterium]|nr:hypothetical protein [Candidatus Omnitrophota bacterium]
MITDSHKIESITSEQARSQVIFQDHQLKNYKLTDQLFAYLMILQWVTGVVSALIISPRTWYGTIDKVHIHFWTALLLGGLISAYPLYLALFHSGKPFTRHIIAVGQMFWSALLIHLTGGRIETHFHVFGSLAFLAFYRDWKVLIPATIVVAGDHIWRGIYWPQSVYGVITASPWRWLEHAWWVIFEDIFLYISCQRSVREMRSIAENVARLESVNQVIESTVQERTKELKEANELLKAEIRERTLAENELRNTQELLIETEKTATVARLAAGAAHEVKNPLTVISQGVDYFALRPATKTDVTASNVLGEMSNAVKRADFIIRGLLNVATFEEFRLAPANINSAIEQALALTKNGRDKKQITVVKQLLADTPSLLLDEHLFTQALINLLLNANEAMDLNGVLEIRTSIRNDYNPDGKKSEQYNSKKADFILEIVDTGQGVASEILDKVFEPFFTTKRATGGTGLGLPIVKKIIQQHGGSIEITNRKDRTGILVRIVLLMNDDCLKNAA